MTATLFVHTRTLTDTKARITPAGGRAQVCGAAIAVALLFLLPQTMQAQDLSGTWKEVSVSSSNATKQWGDNCGSKPRGQGGGGGGRPVQINHTGGVIAIPAAGLRSNICTGARLARKQSYTPFNLRCATAANASPSETANYRYVVSADRQTIRYTAVIRRFWKLKGDTCEVITTTTRVFKRPAPTEEPIAEEPALAKEVPVTPEPPTVAANNTPKPRRPKRAKPTLEESILIPVNADRGPRPSGGSVTPIVSSGEATTPGTEASERPSMATMILGIVLAILLPALLLLILIAFYRRQPDSEDNDSRRQQLATRAARSNRTSGARVSSGSWTSPSFAAVGGGAGSEAASASHGTDIQSSFQTLIGFDDLEDPTDEHRVYKDRLDTAISGRSCPTCSKLFDIAAEFCPYDGTPLEAFEDEFPTVDPVEHVMACPECSKSYEPGSAFCPDDGALLAPEDPHETGFVPVPVIICPQCQREFLTGIQTCPHDGTQLLPLIGRRTSGLPMTGVGPKSRICPECGTRYSEEAQFCGKDGLTLVSLN